MYSVGLPGREVFICGDKALCDERFGEDFEKKTTSGFIVFTLWGVFITILVNEKILCARFLCTVQDLECLAN